MAIFIMANNASSELAGPISAAAVSLNLASGQGALFPNPSAGQQFPLSLFDAATGLQTEIMYCTARAADTLTVVRGQEGTAAQSWLAGDVVANLVTAGVIQAMIQSSALFPARTITASGAFAMSRADANGGVGLNRTSALAASSTTLPATAIDGDVYWIEDLAKNFHDYPVTVTAPAGTTIAGVATAVLNVNGQCAQFRFYADSNLWSFKP